MIKLFLPALLIFLCSSVDAQRLFTRSGNVEFFSDAALEKIEAVNNSATSVMDVESGRVEFAVLIKGFQFEKALMQEHFNENYMESDEFPKATFKGNFEEGAAINWEADGEYSADVSGELTLHGVTKTITAPVQIAVVDGKVKGSSKFTVTVADYDIEIPAVVRDNIAKTVDITIQVDYEELKR